MGGRGSGHLTNKKIIKKKLSGFIGLDIMLGSDLRKNTKSKK